MRATLARLQTLANAVAAALLVWFGAPLIALGGRHPFDPPLARAGLLFALVAFVALSIMLGRLVARRRNARLFERMQAGDAAAAGALEERFRAAMKVLQGGIARHDGARWWRRRAQLYQLPWYLFIGAPGAGKTTALLHSGLHFPLAGRLGREPVVGIGGTRQCDWWFSDRAVFLDTAGRYTTQDSRPASDTREWHAFLGLLRRFRPAQPINGVVVSASVPDLLQGGAEISAQADAVDRRLCELRERLDQSFPVYLLVTKADLLAGFVEFFDGWDAARRAQPWGVTFDAAAPPDFAARLSELVERVAQITPARLENAPSLQQRTAIHHFQAQLEALVPAIESFARRALRSAAHAPAQPVRGIFLSSGTQEGNPIDRVIGELARRHGLAIRPLPRPDAGGKAYFLRTLLYDLVIAEAPLAGTNLQRERLARWLSLTGCGALAALLLVLCAGWWQSYRGNAEYVQAVRTRLAQVAERVGPGEAERPDQWLPLYATLENLAANGGIDPGRAPASMGLGLFQGPRLARSAEQTYHRVLGRTLGPQLAQKLSEALRQESDPIARYEALRVHTMLTTPKRLQRAEVHHWAASAFRVAGAAAPGAAERQEWLHHLDALLERNGLSDALRPDEAAVQAARAALKGTALAQIAHERLLQRAPSRFAARVALADLIGPAATWFAPGDSATLQGLYTREAWQAALEPALAAIVAEVSDESEWVLGTPAGRREEIAAQVARLHAQAASAEWDRLLAGLKPRAPSDADIAAAASANPYAAGGASLRELQRRIALEFAPSVSATPAAGAFDASLTKHYQALVAYARGPAVQLIELVEASGARDAAEPRRAELVRELRSQSERAPPPWRALWAGLADSYAALARRAPERTPAQALAELGASCRELLDDRFPFAAQGRRDMPLADFARLFGPQGLLDGYFRSHLAAQVDVRSRPWRLAGGAASDGQSQALRSFERADDIRRLFFAAGGPTPRLELRLTPARMDDELLQFSVDIDGQLLRYENGPRRPKAFAWPGPAATDRVVLRILPPGPGNVGAEVHEGPWALLRVMPRQNWKRGKGDEAPQVRFVVDGRTLAVEVASDAPVNPAVLGDLSDFRCPEGW